MGTMGEINVFRATNDGGVVELGSETVDLEKQIQSLIEENLEELLGIRFLETEYSTGKKHGGRIDTLGIDENNSPVIIEYKKHKNTNVINQGLYYLDWLMDHKAQFEQVVENNISEEVEVDWSVPRLVCIAPDFTKYDSYAVDQIDQNIELLRFKRYEEDILLFELVNTVESTSGGEGPKREYKGIKEYKEQASDELLQLFSSSEDFIFALGDDVQKKELKYYYAYKRIQNFTCIEIRPQKDELRLYIKLDPDDLEPLPEFARDVSEIGHYGTGDLELTISGEEQLDRAKEFIEMSYNGL